MQREALESSILQIASEKDDPLNIASSQLSGKQKPATFIDILRMVYDKSIVTVYNLAWTWIPKSSVLIGQSLRSGG
jgi:hypothetical protein